MRKDYKSRHSKKRKTGMKFLTVAIIVFLAIMGYKHFFSQPIMTSSDIPNWITQDLIYEADPSEANMRKVNDIVVHYTANPGSTAKENRDYFAQPSTQVNSHFIVGLNGEIIQCVPLYMQSVASNTRNHDTISIEMCHPDSSGNFNISTYNATVKLVAWLCDTYGISRDNVIRHGDITGKNCPKLFMEDEGAWEEFKMYVRNYKFD